MSKKPVIFISSALTSKNYDESNFFEFFIIIMGKLSILLRAKHYELFLRVPEYQEDAVKDQKKFLEALLKDDLTSYSALIISPFERRPLIHAIDRIIRKKKKFPIFTIDKEFRELDFSDKPHIIKEGLIPKSVISNEKYGGNLAAQSIYEYLYRYFKRCYPKKKPFIMILRGLEGSKLRVEGFREEIKRLSEKFNYRVRICSEKEEIKAKFQRTMAQKDAKKFLTDIKCDVQAFFCCNDEMALGVRDELERRLSLLNIKRNKILESKTPDKIKHKKIELIDEEINKIKEIKIVGYDGIKETRILLKQGDCWILNSIDTKIIQQTINLTELLFRSIGEIKESTDKIETILKPELIVALGDQNYV